jgi:hypothetical protein
MLHRNLLPAITPVQRAVRARVYPKAYRLRIVKSLLEPLASCQGLVPPDRNFPSRRMDMTNRPRPGSWIRPMQRELGGHWRLRLRLDCSGPIWGESQTDAALLPAGLRVFVSSQSIRLLPAVNAGTSEFPWHALESHRRNALHYRLRDAEANGGFSCSAFRTPDTV